MANLLPYYGNFMKKVYIAKELNSQLLKFSSIFDGFVFGNVMLLVHLYRSCENTKQLHAYSYLCKYFAGAKIEIPPQLKFIPINRAF
jgi:hypothetical protein